ncbi:hypothetical protein BJ944DRAFT_243396 [Cunninghamella echinulata]|nr:hypothetical protein BJ944DRAFT_243396 [Cunninghamella echinulata]
MNDMEMDLDMSDINSPSSATVHSFQDDYSTQEQDLQQEQNNNSNNAGQPIKIRKKPGRKPNPASPSLRKAQNRAAQRAFRERKERHMRELETAIKQIREQRDKLFIENEQLKSDSEILRSENWYLKGIVLSLQLVCYQHKLAIPQHGPFINDQALSVMALSTPEPIAAYMNVNANSKLPTPTQLNGYRHSIKQRDRYLSSGSILVTKDDVSQQRLFPSLKSMPPLQSSQPSPSSSVANEIGFSAPSPSSMSTSSSSTHHQPILLQQQQQQQYHHHQQQQQQQQQKENEMNDDDQNTINMPSLSPVEKSSTDINMPTIPLPSSSSIPRPPQSESITSNLAAIQTLRLRLRLQSACARMDSVPFSIQPTLLQLTIPHDPRIDLIPTAHMRDRMILFREQFDLDDCFKCLLSSSVFHGGDPAEAGNWQLPKEFFEKYWFLTIDYTLRRTTNRWRVLQGLNELENDLGTNNDSASVVDGQSTNNNNQSNNSIKSNTSIKDDDDNSTIKNEMNNNKQDSHLWDNDTLSASDSAALAGIPALEVQSNHSSYIQKPLDTNFGVADLSAYLGIEFSKIEKTQRQQQQQQQLQYISSSSSIYNQNNNNQNNNNNNHTHTLNHHHPNSALSLNNTDSPLQQFESSPDCHSNDSFEPIRLTNGYLLPQKHHHQQQQQQQQQHLNQINPTLTLPSSIATYLEEQQKSILVQDSSWEKGTGDPSHSGYDLLVNSFIHSDSHSLS